MEEPSLSCDGERQLCYAAGGADPVATRGHCRPGRKAEGRGSHSGAGGHRKTSLYLLWGFQWWECPLHT